MNLNKKDFFSIIILTSLFGGIFYLSGLIVMLSNILNIIIFALIYWFIYIFFKKIFRSKKILSPSEFLSFFAFFYSILIFILVASIASFSYYFNEKSPAYLQEYTLTNGEKTVVFQEMMHIGGEDFYSQVSKNLQKYRNDDFVHFFEGVKPGSEENMKELNKALGFEFDKDLYPNISKLLGVKFQNYIEIMGQITEKDINVDLSVDDVIEEYKKLKSENKSEVSEKEVVEASKILKETVEKLNQRELKLVSYIGKSVINAMISNPENLKSISISGENAEIMKAILNKRDKNLAEEIQNSEYKKIYVTYGALHFPGVLENLQEKDKNWKIEKVEKIKAL